MLQRKVVVRNRAGIHCRPASVILNTINTDFPDVKLTVESSDGEIIQLNSILGLISLGLQCGQSIRLTAEGDNAEAALEKIGDLFMFEFDFPPQ